jgi:integrase
LNPGSTSVLLALKTFGAASPLQPGLTGPATAFADLEGQHLDPEHFTRNFGGAVARCRKELGEDLPLITLHGLRHTHVSVLLSSGVPVETVSARIGHSTPIVTMTIYAHLLAGDDEVAAGTFAALVSAEYHGPSQETGQEQGAGQ